MKLKLIAAIAVITGAAACVVQKKPQVSYEFPPEMTGEVKKSYIAMWEKGRILYDINCSRCHNQVVKRKTIIPEFTEEQLATYEIRVADPQHEMFVSDAKVNTEELALITLFLTYRKHDSAALKKLLATPRDHSHDNPM